MPEPESTPTGLLSCPLCGEPNDAISIRSNDRGVHVADCRDIHDHIWSVRWFEVA